MNSSRVLVSVLTATAIGGTAATAAQVYFDAPAPDTTVGDIYFRGTAGDWVERTTGPAANAFATTAQQGSGSPAGSAVTSSMVLSNLAASATFTSVRIYYIGKAETDTGNNWDFNYSYNGESGSVLDEIDGINVDLSNGGVGAPASTTGDIRYYTSVPDFTTDGSGQIEINFARPSLDRTSNPATARYVIEGIGFDNVAVPEPSVGSLALLAFGFGFLRRSRR